MSKLTVLRTGLHKLAGTFASAGKMFRYGASSGNGKDIFAMAIEKRMVLEIRYEGHVGYFLVEPHVYGRREDGARFLLAYRLKQGLEDGQTEGWVTLALADIVSAYPSGNTFDGPRQRPGQAGSFESTIAELPAPA